MDTQSRNRTSPDFEALTLAQRILVPAGPHAHYPAEVLEAIHTAIKGGVMLEFNYQAEGRPEAAWRRVIPYGILHGSISYLIGAIPGREESPVLYRLDRMSETEATDLLAIVPEDFNLPEWCQDSFGVWRDGPYEIVLRIVPEAADRARNWRFHPRQEQRAEKDGGLTFTFRAGGLQELVDHLFCWGDEVEILEPTELKKLMAKRLELALEHHSST
jgi:predicted DNA-binding transcriptional regulator YafY